MLSSTTSPDVLIHVDEAESLGGSGRELRTACRRGLLVRVRRGTYCPRDVWDALDSRERHILAIRAAIRRVRGPFLVAGRSAAALWDLPYAATELDDVLLLVPYPGGGSTEPGVRRTAASFDSAEHHVARGIPVTSYTRTALDVARGLDPVRGVAVLDWARSRRNPHAVGAEDLLREWDRARFARGSASLRRLIEFSTSLSDSVGESECRAAIHRAGFEVPVLQREWRDSEGVMETDFYWESVNVAGEFDGKMKYTRAEFTGGDPAEVVWREKRREDRLRRQVDRVVRLITADVHRPVVLAGILDDAGVPRRARR